MISAPVSLMDIQIIPYAPAHGAAFKRLNEEWIQAYFKIEAADRHVLDHPHENILGVGGHILVVAQGDEVVGVCALLPHDEQTYELAKMAVSPSVQGRGVGLLLGQAAIAKATACGKTRLWLESNTRLESAIRLYRKLGFTECNGESPHYERCNIAMERPLP